ncbi:hypothetical protein [Rhizobium sp. AB2/73]|uniref:hypothetical protein n=1 Tax=Rhizobium sp. AB2/73 TaxID=2795216 RepID=UPI001C5F74B7|nr:hypothetical protein [Rhizobium sp. AB2/73]QYA11714.1 hypothetical protein J5284_14375 [Rhizobium sp. AB2/73]UEQ82356.1 hypothetical protein I8E17_07630 [Rhizobium sp. AB2/73]
MIATIQDLGHKQGWSDEQISAETATQTSDLYRQRTLLMAQDDPVQAADFLEKNKDKLDPVTLINTRQAIMKPLSEAAGRDAVANVQAHGGKTGQSLDQVTDRIIGAESGGDASASNPNSSASGLGQFLDSTWVSMVRKYRPDLAGQSNADLIAMKSDPSLGREMTMRYAQENAATLQQAGYAPTAGNIYLAHFLGPAGAKQVLGANERKQASDVLPAAVIAANPFLKGMTIADLQAWAEKKMGGSGGVVPTYSPRVASVVNAMPGNLRQQLNEASNQDVQSWATGQASIAKAQQLQVENSVKLRIAQGDTSLTAAEINNNAALDDGAKATLLNSFNEKFKQIQQTQDDIASFAAGKLVVDPYSEDGRKRVNAIWTEATKNSQQGADNRPIVSGIVQQTGMVPTPVMGALRKAATSQNPKAVEQALSYSSQLRQIDPHVFARSAGGSDIEDKAVLYDHLTGMVGLSSGDATRKIMELNDPQKQADRNALIKSPDTEKWLKDTATENDARNVFYPGFFSTNFTPKLGETPAQAAAATAEYRDILQESLVDTNGDKELAKTLAGERFKKRYGVSDYNLSGTKAITRLPPEVTYPVGTDGTWGYIGDQAKDALKKEGVTAREVFLQSDDRTNADVKAGNPARYVLFYKDGDGFIQQYQHPFYAEPPTRSQVFEAQKKQAEAKRDANITAVEEQKKAEWRHYYEQAGIDVPDEYKAKPQAKVEPAQPKIDGEPGRLPSSDALGNAVPN